MQGLWIGYWSTLHFLQTPTPTTRPLLLPAQGPLVLEGSASSPLRSWSILVPSPELPAPHPSFPPLYPSTFVPLWDLSKNVFPQESLCPIAFTKFSQHSPIYLYIMIYSSNTLHYIYICSNYNSSNNICEGFFDWHLSPTLEYKLYESRCKVCFAHSERSYILMGLSPYYTHVIIIFCDCWIHKKMTEYQR